MIFNSNSNIEPVVEKFVGKSDKRFRRIEKLVAIQVNRINEGTASMRDMNLPVEVRRSKAIGAKSITMHELNTSKENKELEKLFKDLFGLKNFYMIWDLTPDANAFTFIKNYLVFDEETRKNGIHQGSKKSINVTVNAGLIRKAELEPNEVLAIILHEIGHNFYNSIFQILSSLPLNFATGLSNAHIENMLINLPFQILFSDIIPLGTLYAKFSLLFMKVLGKFPMFEKILRMIHMCADFIHGSVDKIMGIVFLPKAIGNLINFVKNSGMMDFNHIFTYNVEKHADSFAVDYGYGVELATGLSKFSNMTTYELDVIAGKNRTTGFIGDLLDVQNELFGLVMSSYPSNQNRIRTGLDRCRRSLKDETLAPQIRKELENQLKEYEDFYYNDYLSKDMQVTQKGKVVGWCMRISIEKMFAGKLDIREILHAVDPKKYE